MTVKELRERLERDFHDDEEIKFNVCLDGGHRTSYYGYDSVFIRSIENEGLGEGDVVISLSGDVDDEG